MIHLHYIDRMKFMAKVPDNYYDLAFVDPEYGMGADKPSKKKTKVLQKDGSELKVPLSNHSHKNWDKSIPPPRYFKELFRVSKHQIIWGSNYFPKTPTGGRIVWDKMNCESDQYGCEIAYCSLNTRTDIIYYRWHGMIQGEIASRNPHVSMVQIGDKKLNETTLHPTHKPTRLLRYMLKKYAKPNWKILDTGFGSASLAVSVYFCNKDLKMNLTYDGCENDKEYFQKGSNWLGQYVQDKQIPLL